MHTFFLVLFRTEIIFVSRPFQGSAVGFILRIMTGCFTGRNLSTLPVEPKLGKMLIFGAIFNCLDPIMTVVAGLSARDPFLMPFDKKDVRFILCVPCEILMIFYVLVCISVFIFLAGMHDEL